MKLSFPRYLDEFIDTPRVSAFWLQKGKAGGQSSLWHNGEGPSKVFPRSLPLSGKLPTPPSARNRPADLINTDDQIVGPQSKFLPQLSTRLLETELPDFPLAKFVEKQVATRAAQHRARQLCPHPALQTRAAEERGLPSGSPASSSLYILATM